jgi:pyruvate dehydrogenase E1 component alpha subunit
VPRRAQTGARTLAQKALAAGFDGVQVDGNDVIAVHHAVKEALAKARSGGGPTLIEALTYRLGDHTTADDASRYRPAEEVAEAWKNEPVARLRTYLLETGMWSKGQEEELLRRCNEHVQAEAQAYLDAPMPPVHQMFDYLHAMLPGAYAAQRAAILDEASEHGADHSG